MEPKSFQNVVLDEVGNVIEQETTITGASYFINEDPVAILLYTLCAYHLPMHTIERIISNIKNQQLCVLINKHLGQWAIDKAKELE